MLGTVQWQHADILLVDKASQYWSHLRGELKAFVYYVHFGHLFYAKRNQQVRDVRLKTDVLYLRLAGAGRGRRPSLTLSEIG